MKILKNLNNINLTITYHHLQKLNLLNFTVISSSNLSFSHLIIFLSHFLKYHCHKRAQIYLTPKHCLKSLVVFTQK